MSWNRADIGGQWFGHLLALRYSGTKNGKALWKCICDCGRYRTVQGSNLRTGNTSSCGCRERRKHGHATKANTTREYRSWDHMIQRCTNPRNDAWSDYGGRGIKVCDEWTRFETFLADMGARPKRMSIDRIDVNGNYEPSNCRWATQGEQNLNRRKTRG